MAGKREIKTTLKLDGEQQFKKGMSDAASAIKELNSEQKLAEAQFEATGDAEKYAADKTRILKEKIEQQQKSVAAAESAIKAMKESGIDPNSKAMQTWRTKLNNAKTSLTRMQTQLNNTEAELAEQGEALDSASTDAGEYKDAINKAAEAVDFSATITAIDNVRDTIGKIIETAYKAGKAMWNLERGAAGWADELQTNADVAGLDVVDYQGWQYASQMIDSSVDSIRGAYKRLNKNLDEPKDEILKTLNELSVANLNFNGSARDTMDVFWDIIDAMGQVENTSRRDQMAMDLFGKSYDDLLPLIKAGSAAYKDFIEQGKEKAVSEENIGKLTSLDDTINRLNASFDKTKYTILAELAPAFETAATAITEALEAFDEFIESEEGQQSLQNLRDAIGSVAEKIKDTDWKAVMDGAASVIERINSALAWLADHSGVVIGTVGGLAAAWTGLSVSEKVLSALQLLKTIQWAQISKVAASGAANAAAGGAAAGANGAGNAVAAISGGGSIIGGIAGVAGLAAGFAWARHERLTNENIRGSVNAISEATAQSDKLKAAFDEYVSANKDLKQYLDAGIIEGPEIEAAIDRVNAATEALNAIEGAYEALQALSDWRQENGYGDMDWEHIPDDIANSISANANAPIEAADAMAAEVENAASSVDAETIGYNISAGVAEGIYNGYDLAVGAAEAMGQAVSGALSRVLMIKSPSRVMMGLGEYVSEGFAIGIEDNISRVERATNRMVAATMGRVRKPDAPADTGGQNGMVHVTLVLDGQEVADVITPYVDGNFSAQIQRRR